MTRHEQAGTLHHATCIVLAGRGILIRGPSGSGKSDLALRLIDAAGHGIGSAARRARLVADDQVHLRRMGERVVATAPKRLKDQIEIRGLGIVRVSARSQAPLALVVDLVDGRSIERMPDEPLHAVVEGVRLPLLRLDPRSPSAAARVRAGLAALASPARRGGMNVLARPVDRTGPRGRSRAVARPDGRAARAAAARAAN
jgi:serine kinase of HPr protein (carbohydrate metabolism regulator)